MVLSNQGTGNEQIPLTRAFMEELFKVQYKSCAQGNEVNIDMVCNLILIHQIEAECISALMLRINFNERNKTNEMQQVL